VATQVDCYNLALTHLDISQTVNSINDNTPAAGTLNKYWDLARQKVLEGAHWGFATKATPIALILDQATLAANAIIYPGWRYVYARPVDAFRMLAVTTAYGLRVNPSMAFWWNNGGMAGVFGSWGAFRPPWRQSIDQVNTANPGQSIDILTDQVQAYAVYVTDVQNVGLWSSSFLECVSWQLAEYAAGPLSANQAAKQLAIKMAKLSITTALEKELNEQQSDPYPDSPAITART